MHPTRHEDISPATGPCAEPYCVEAEGGHHAGEAHTPRKRQPAIFAWTSRWRKRTTSAPRTGQLDCSARNSLMSGRTLTS